MAEAEASLLVIDADASLPAVARPLDPALRERWNDYGICCCKETCAADIVRRNPDGPVNVARARLQEGDVADDVEAIARLCTSSWNGVRTWDAAMEHLQTARAQYPRDRVCSARSAAQFLQRQDDAIATFEEPGGSPGVLMLSHQGAGHPDAVARERALYERTKADRRRVTGRSGGPAGGLRARMRA